MDEPLKCPGIGRDGDDVRTMWLYFTRKLTNDEMRQLHAIVQQWAESTSEPTPMGRADVLED